jgi:hypothetical protein
VDTGFRRYDKNEGSEKLPDHDIRLRRHASIWLSPLQQQYDRIAAILESACFTGRNTVRTTPNFHAPIQPAGATPVAAAGVSRPGLW